MPESGLINEWAVQAEGATVEGTVNEARLRPPRPVNGHRHTQRALQHTTHTNKWCLALHNFELLPNYFYDKEQVFSKTKLKLQG